MKHALVDGQLTLASQDAPARAICPGCGRDVGLRVRQGTFFWRHLQRPRGGCQPTVQPDTSFAVDGIEAGGAGGCQAHRVGDLIVELRPDGEDGRHLKLRRLSAEAEDSLSELTVLVSEVPSLIRALRKMLGG